MCALTTGGRVHPIIGAGRCAMESVAAWKRIGGWVSRGFLALLILFMTQYWLDILVFDPGEYERLIGSEAACGVAGAYCSWTAFVLYNAPLMALAVAASGALVWRTMPRREQVLAALAIVTCIYVVGRASKSGLAAICAETGLFL